MRKRKTITTNQILESKKSGLVKASQLLKRISIGQMENRIQGLESTSWLFLKRLSKVVEFFRILELSNHQQFFNFV